MTMNDERTVEGEQETLEVEQDERPVEPAMSGSAENADEPAGSVAMQAGDEAQESQAASDGSLLPADQNDRFTTKWEEIQGSFVDRPQEAVEQADALVADLMQRVTGGLTSERERLESQWASGEDVSTEDLRVALTRYRTFFDRLLSA